MMQQQAPILKTIMVGSGGVGKSALTLEFMYNEFMKDYEPTKADSYRKKLTLDGEEVQIDILDTAGQEEYVAIRENYFRSGEGFILVYAIDDPESFKELPIFCEQVYRAKNTDKLPMILVANKKDLKNSTNASLVQAGAEFADKRHIPFLETSALNGDNVERVFLDIARDIRQRQLANMQGPKTMTSKKRRKKCTIL
ncbi:unnamed protein product [Calicophoron daubneyi]|uniref:Uncharacterized protein n=1 Tax=Calicophoron daubneyi TaxID=300641 RepID=A0AAV2TU11_CALDB